MSEHSSFRVTLSAKALLTCGVLIFAVSFYFNSVLGQFLPGDFCEMVGTAGLVSGAFLIVLRLRGSWFVNTSFFVGGFFLVLARAIDFGEELAFLDGIAIVGNGGWAHELAERASESFGYICLLLTMLGLMHQLSQMIDASEQEGRRYKELYQSTHYLARVADLSVDAVVAVNDSGSVQVWNRGAQRLFGYSKDAGLRLNVRDLIVDGPVGFASNVVEWSKTAEDNREVEVTGRRKDGKEFAAGATVSPVSGDDGETVGASIVVRNIEERKRAERELIASRNLLTRALQAADVGLFILDRNLELIEFNQRMEWLTGFTTEELKREHATFAGTISELLDEPAAFAELITDLVIDRGEHAEFRNLTFHRRDGTTRVCSGGLAPVLDDKGAVMAIAGVAVDVTDREALQAKLLESQKMESIGRLAGGIAHDFNNILAGVLGYATLVKESVDPGSPNRKRMEAIEESAVRASELTRQLLTFARGGTRKMDTLSLNEVAEDTSKLLAHTLNPNLRVVFKGDPELDSVHADSTQMHQIVMNLCLNSRDALGESGEIRISTANVDVDAEFAERQQLPQPGRYVCLTVEDTGSGIAPDAVDHIFEPFFSTKKQGQAFGLGLSVVYGIVQSHGGGIAVQSTVGEGTRIDVYLPSSGQQKVTRREQITIRRGDDMETVLVVDDEKLIRTLLQDMLSMSGYRVLEASTGEEALDMYSEYGAEIGLIILDVVMPGMGGGRALEKLIEINPDVRCIVSSGYGSELIDSRLLTERNVRFVAKPFQTANVMSTVRELMQN